MSRLPFRYRVRRSETEPGGRRFDHDPRGPFRGMDFLVGCVLTRIGGAPSAPRVLDTRPEWYAALADVFGLELPDLDAADRDALWIRVRTAHEVWSATR